MTFFPEIDRKKTKKQAVRKLNEYFRWCLVADTTGEQKVTASYTFEPRQAECSPSKPVERLAINRIAAQQELEAIRRAISNLFYPVHRPVLHHQR